MEEFIKSEPPEDEELVAYLDGELEVDRAREIEDLLVRDPGTRSRLNDLERTWDVLDRLPRTEPNDVFTRSTMELVLNDASRGLQRTRAARTRRLVATAMIVAAPIIMAAGAFWAVRQKQEQPMNDLVRDLHVIRNFEIYSRIPDIRFLEDLRDSGAFSTDDSSNTEAPPK